jgi:hypothetical protein
MVRTRLPDTLLVAGVPLPSLYPERFSGIFVAVFRGQVDLSFPRFCKDLFDLKITRLSLNNCHWIAMMDYS